MLFEIWTPGNLDLLALASLPAHEQLPTKTPQLFIIPMTKSALTGQQSPVRTVAFLLFPPNHIASGQHTIRRPAS